MSKSKKKSNNVKSILSDLQYLKSGKSRNLPISNCLISEDWENAGIAQIIIMRRHINNNVTAGIYLIDLYCVGVKDTFFLFNIDERELMSSLSGMEDLSQFKEFDYVIAHNMIYGSIEFASEFGIEPHKDFKLTAMILEEDSDDIPLIDIEFGKKGVPVLICDSDHPKLNYYLNQLNRFAGEGNYIYLEDNDEDLDFIDQPNTWEEEDWLDFFEDLESCETEVEVKDTLIDYSEAVKFIYEKIIVEPEFAVKKLSPENLITSNFQITYEPIDITNYNSTPQEIKEGKLAYSIINEGNKEELTSLVKRLQLDSSKWPNNPIFLNYLYTTYQMLEQDSKAKEAVKLITKNFPSYLFGKVNYATQLMYEGKIDRVPDVFGGNYHLKAIYPEREVFHIQEFIAFNTIMCLYFIRKEEIYSANIYRNMIFNVEIPEEIYLNEQVFFELDMKILDYVKPIIIEASLNANKKRDLLNILLH